MSDVAARWGSLIRSKRLRADLSQVVLAERVGRQQSVISRWENGLQSPTLDDQARLIRVLDITADELSGIYTGTAA